MDEVLVANASDRVDCPRSGCTGFRQSMLGGMPLVGCPLIPTERGPVLIAAELAPLIGCGLMGDGPWSGR